MPAKCHVPLLIVVIIASAQTAPLIYPYPDVDQVSKEPLLLPVRVPWQLVFKRGSAADAVEEDQIEARDLMLKSPVFSFSLCCR
uniref:Uncharacterized protein n=1 Tax=Plectus sambesii TaxID=2011161 RepID=A0A914UHZ9_9BILA